MKFLTVERAGEARLALALDEARAVDLTQASAGALKSMVGLIEAGEAGLAEAQRLAGDARAGKLSAAVFELAGAKLLAPIPRPAKNVFCVGRNYAEHVAEVARAQNDQGRALPQHPHYFTKPPTAVLAPDGVFKLDTSVTQKLDYEVELGVVIGKTGRDISEDSALDHVFGYTVINDITARDLQRLHEQWFKGKGLDGSCPMGPWIVHKSAIADPQQLAISLTVNGETRQSSNTAQMIFNVRRIISVLSKGMTLEAGDVIATGTPSGVGMGMDPPAFLKAGDTVTCTIEKIGSLTTRIA